MDAPRISVLIAAFNPRYLRAALQSVAAQTRQDLEIVIRDDSRGDAVAEVVRVFTAQTRLPVDYARNETQLGVRRNYEACFAASRGEYIKFLNDDDLLDPTCIEKLARALDDNPTVNLATSHRRRIDERGGPLRDTHATAPVITRDALVEGGDLINALLLLDMNFVGEPSTAMFRRSAIAPGTPLFEFLGDPGRGISDLVLWCRLAEHAPVAFLAARLSSFRIHGEQRQNILDIQKMGIDSVQLMRGKWIELGRHLDMPPNVLRVAPLPTGGTAPPASSDWGYSAINAFTPPGSDVRKMVDDWRGKRHPFFASQPG